MPASGKKDMMSDAEIGQRQQAAKKHGVYSIRDRGSDAMTPQQKGRRAELQEQLDTRAGTVSALKEQAVETFILASVAQSYCVEQHQAGKPLDQIPLLTRLPGFWNSANRALKTYLDALPKNDDNRPIGDVILAAVRAENDNDNS